MAIVDANGVPVPTRTRKATAAAFDISHGFDLPTGRGFVKIGLLGIVEAVKALSSTDGIVKLEDVMALLSAPQRLQPAEAKHLGYQLICYGEECIGNAITMRLLIEGGIDALHAVRMLQEVSHGTRADHAMAWERAMREAQIEEQMEQPSEGQTS